MRAPSSRPNHLSKAYLLIPPPCGTFQHMNEGGEKYTKDHSTFQIFAWHVQRDTFKFAVFFYIYLPGQTSQTASGDSVMLKRCQMQFLAEAEQCMKVKSESEVAQSCSTLRDPMDCNLPGSSVHGIFQARVLEWGAIVFSVTP